MAFLDEIFTPTSTITVENTSDAECKASETSAIDAPNIPASNLNTARAVFIIIVITEVLTATFSKSVDCNVFSVFLDKLVKNKLTINVF